MVRVYGLRFVAICGGGVLAKRVVHEADRAQARVEPLGREHVVDLDPRAGVHHAEAILPRDVRGAIEQRSRAFALDGSNDGGPGRVVEVAHDREQGLRLERDAIVDEAPRAKRFGGAPYDTTERSLRAFARRRGGNFASGRISKRDRPRGLEVRHEDVDVAEVRRADTSAHDAAPQGNPLSVRLGIALAKHGKGERASGVHASGHDGQARQERAADAASVRGAQDGLAVSLVRQLGENGSQKLRRPDLLKTHDVGVAFPEHARDPRDLLAEQGPFGWRRHLALLCRRARLEQIFHIEGCEREHGDPEASTVLPSSLWARRRRPAACMSAPVRAFDDDVLIVRHNRIILAAAGAPLALGSALAVAGVWHAAIDLVGVGVALAWLGAGTLFYAWARNPGRVLEQARARADAGGLYFNGELALSAPRVRGGWVEPHLAGLPTVHIRACRRADMALVVRSLDQARALLAALEVDPTRAPAHLWTLARPLGEPRAFGPTACLLGLAVVLGAVLGQAAPLALALAAVALIVLFAGVAVPTRVMVGADGVLMRWLGTENFVPWSSVVAIEPFDGGVVLALAKGQWLTLRMPAAHQRYHPEREAVVERMQVAWRAHARTETDEAAAGLVRREGNRTREWVRAMRTLMSTEQGYRQAALPPERLWRVVEDPSAEGTARIGAAVALAASLDDAGRERLRAAAAACVEPRVRVALGATATSEMARLADEDLAATIDAIDFSVAGLPGADGANHEG